MRVAQEIIGWRKSGAPIYLIRGAEDGGSGGQAGGSAGGSGSGTGSAGSGAGTDGSGAGSGVGGSGTGSGTPVAGSAPGGTGDQGAGATPPPVTLNPVAVQQLAALGWTPPDRQTTPGETAGFGTGLPSYGHREALEKIVELRAENGRDRAGAKTAAANEVHQVYAQLIGAEAKPEAITARLAGLVDADTRAQSAELRLSVYQRAATIGANADRLLDSARFMAGLSGLDPAKVDALDAKIREAVDADPVYRTQGYQAKPPPAGQAVQGFQGTQITPDAKPRTLTNALDALYSN